VFIKTVAKLPTTIFLVSAGVITLSLALMMLVRLPAGMHKANAEEERVHERDETVVAAPETEATRKPSGSEDA
jgi:hypothetical protein